MVQLDWQRVSTVDLDRPRRTTSTAADSIQGSIRARAERVEVDEEPRVSISELVALVFNSLSLLILRLLRSLLLLLLLRPLL